MNYDSKQNALMLVLLVLSIPLVARPEPLNTWTWRNPLPTGNALQSIIYENGQYVVVGSPGTIITSTDGKNWIQRQTDPLSFLNSVAYGNGQFVAVGGRLRIDWAGKTVNDGYAILTSTDGVNWIPRGTTLPLFDLGGVAFGWGLFVAVGGGGSILTSDNGVDWDQRSSGTDAILTRVAFGGGQFVGVGAGALLTSPDGVNWTQRRAGAGYWLYGITYSNGQFVVTGSGISDVRSGRSLSDAIIWTSKDGVTWLTRSSGVQNDLLAVTYGNEQFVAIGNGRILTSPNGADWTPGQDLSGTSPSDVVYANDQFTAVGSDGTILTSPDGNNWIRTGSSSFSDLTAITFGNGQFVTVGRSTSDGSSNLLFRDSAILTSADGVNWIRQQSGTTNALIGVVYGGGRYVAVGSEILRTAVEPPAQYRSVVLTSTDSANWVSSQLAIASPVSGIAYGNDRFVIVGETTILTSSDAVGWTQHPLGARAIAYGKGQFVALGAGGMALNSVDGETWIPHPTGAQTLTSIAYGQGQFVAVGFDCGNVNCIGAIVTSTDGTNWVRRPGLGDVLLAVTYGNGRFLAAGESGTLLTSSDGVNWVVRQPRTYNQLAAAAYGTGRFVVVGSGGTILQSDPIINLSIAPTADRELLSLSLEGPPGIDYTIQSSSDLVSWREVTTITASPSSKITLDGLPVTPGNLFYRAQSQ
jgi:hypothetical protein